MRKHLLRILTLVFVVCFGACLFAACGGDEDENKDDQPTTYTLTYNANGGTGADVTESHTEGEKVTLKAANTFTYSGHTFKAWNDGTKDYSAGAEFTMPASNVTLKAQWTENGETPPAPTTYKVTVSGDHVKATFDKAGPYEEGTTVTFTLTVDSGFELVSVKNGTADVVKGTDGKYSVTVGKADITITVTTKSTEQPTPQKYTVTMAANANVDFAIVEPTGTSFEKDTVVKFTVTPHTGYTVKSVKNGTTELHADSDGKYSVTVGEANIVITVETEATQTPVAKHSVTMAANDNVTFAIVEPTEAGPYAEGTTVKFTVTPKTGYTVTSVKNGDNVLTADSDGKYSVVVGNADITITVTTAAGQTPVAKHEVTVTGEHVKATFDAEGPYAEGSTVKFTLKTDNGYKLVSVKNGTADVVKGEDGKYSVTVGKADIAITVTTEKIAKGEKADTASKDVVKGGRENAQTDTQNNKNKFMLWWVEGANWNCGDVVTFSPATPTMDENGKLSFQYKGGNRNYSVQLFYFNDKLVHEEYYVTLTIKSNVALSIIVNGEPVELKAGEDTAVEVLFKNCVVVAQDTPAGETYALDIQFPGTTASTDPKNLNAGVDLGTNETVNIEVSGVEWYCIDGNEENSLPYEKVEVTPTAAEIKADDNGAYFVLKGTAAEGAIERNVLMTLKYIYFDLQEVNNGWRPYVFTETDKTVAFADGTWTLQVSLLALPVRDIGFTVHLGGSNKNLSLTKEQAVPDGKCEFGLYKYTLTNFNGDTDANKAEKNWGAVAVKVQSKYAVTSADLEGDESAVYFVLSGTYEEDCDTVALKAALEKEYFDLQGNADDSLGVDGKAGNWERIVGIVPVVTIDTEKKTWTIKYDISVATDSAYSIHFGLYYPDQKDGGYKYGNSAENGMGIALEKDKAPDNKKVTLGVRTFTLVNKNGETDAGNKANLYWGKLGLTVSYKEEIAYTDATLTKGEDGKVYLSFNGTYEGYTEAELRALAWYADLEPNGNIEGMDWGTAIVLKNGVLTIDAEKSSWSMTYDITGVAAGYYTTHFSYKGAKHDFVQPKKDSKTEATAGNKTYVLVSYNSTDGSKYWGCYGVEISEIPVEEPTFTFDRNGATEGDDPEIELGGTEGGVYNVTLPENPFTAPANKYFRGWEIKEVVYFPGEKVEVEPGTEVTLKAIWEELMVEATHSANVLDWFTAGSASTVLVEGRTVELVATVADTKPLEWHGIVPDINMNVNGTNYWLHFRVDGYVWTATTANSNETDDLKNLTTADSNWDKDKYVALITNKSAIAVITATLASNKLTYTYANYESTDTERANAVTSITWEITSSTPITTLNIGFLFDDAADNSFSVTNATLKGSYVLSANQAPTAEAPITVGTNDNAMAYSGNAPAWTSTLKKGEKVVLKGTMTSVANATTAGNYNAMLAYLYSGFTPVAAIRSDNYIVDQDVMLNAEGLAVAMTPTIQDETKHEASEIKDDTAFWASMRAIIANCTAEMTFDYTDASKIVITIVYTGDDNKFTQTYTFTAKEGQTLKDEYKIGVGGDHNYTVLTSLVRTSVKAAD